MMFIFENNCISSTIGGCWCSDTEDVPSTHQAIRDLQKHFSAYLASSLEKLLELWKATECPQLFESKQK